MLDLVDWCMTDQYKVVADEKASLGDQAPQDVMSWLLKAEDENDRSAPPGEGAFQEDSRLMIIAGRQVSPISVL